MGKFFKHPVFKDKHLYRFIGIVLLITFYVRDWQHHEDTNVYAILLGFSIFLYVIFEMLWSDVDAYKDELLLEQQQIEDYKRAYRKYHELFPKFKKLEKENLYEDDEGFLKNKPNKERDLLGKQLMELDIAMRNSPYDGITEDMFGEDTGY